VLQEQVGLKHRLERIQTIIGDEGAAD